MQLFKTQADNESDTPPEAPPPSEKRQRLQKAILKETLIGAVVMLLLGGAMYSTSGWGGDQSQTRDRLRAAISQVTAEASQLQMRLDAAEKAQPTFDRVFKDPAQVEIALDRQQAAEIIGKLTEQYGFVSPRLSMALVKDMDGTKFKNRFATGNYVEMTLGLEALSDEHIVSFISKLREALPGVAKISAFSLTRAGEITPQALEQIAQSGRVALVKAEIKIAWMGIRPNATAMPGAGGMPLPFPPPGGM